MGRGRSDHILRIQITTIDPFQNKQPAEMQVFYC
ncbi:hypothetical protein NTHI1209_00844 [Haemophilus influenzae]|uniref:Uncharacterized protein n=1 Tax=Haemophilus influenzae TaxID=727 RepID=A0A158SWJ6_HAEIF|nr:hypothetical protein NTHI1209_00844 [Haemophilus influenzae]